MSRAREALSPARRKRAAQRFAQAAGLQQAGKLGEAERVFRKVIETDPAHAPALHALALLRHRQGRRDEAIALLEQGAHGHDTDAGLFNNLGNMLREAGRGADAAHAYRRAVAQDPGHLSAQFNLAALLLAAGDAGGAQAGYERVLAVAPRDVAALIGLGRALLAQQQGEPAIARLREALALAPDDPGCALAVSQALLAGDRIDDALDVAREALTRWPEDPRLLHALADAQLVVEDFTGAERTLRRLRALVPQDAQALTALVRALAGQLRLDDAIGECDAFIAAWPRAAHAFASKGNALKLAGRLEQAVAAFEQALALDPRHVMAWNNLAQTWVDLGEAAHARECLQRALALDPDAPEALFNLVSTRRNGPQHLPEIERIERLAGTAGLSLSDRASLHFALGKAFDDLGEPDRAFAHYDRANACKRRTVRFDAVQFEQWAQGCHDTFTATFFAQREGFGCDSTRPVFIVGMPRSGTTLVEQILASHPQVYGADELTVIDSLANSLPGRLGVDVPYPRAAASLDAASASALGRAYVDHLATLDAHRARVTDKMPENFFHLGLIAAILPRARIVHCRRDAMDTCFSNFIQLFGDGHYYSYSLDDIAVYYREYARIMQHWHEVLPTPLHELCYEELVEEPEAQIRALLASLDLPWDDACLSFHDTRRAVRTASHWQVRQPIYRSARARWRRYARHLQDLAAQIGYRDPAPA